MIAGTQLNHAALESFCSFCPRYVRSAHPASKKCSSERPSETCPLRGSFLTCTNPVTSELTNAKKTWERDNYLLLPSISLRSKMNDWWWQLSGNKRNSLPPGQDLNILKIWSIQSETAKTDHVFCIFCKTNV